MRDRPSTLLRYLLVGYVLVPLPINLIVTYVISWALLGRLDAIAVWGFPSSAHGELLGVNFFLPLITAALCIPKLNAHIGSGLVETDGVPASPWWEYFSPRGWHGYVGFAIAMSVVLAGPAYWTTSMFFAPEISVADLIFWKSIYAGVLGLIVTPAIAVSAIGSFKSRASRSAVEKPDDRSASGRPI